VTDEARPRRRVHRGEGEVTEWPRGLASYVPAGPDDAEPSPDEDRLANRIQLAARLLALRRAAGETMDPVFAELRAAERALRAGDRATATDRLDRVLVALDAAAEAPGPRRAARRRGATL